MARTRTRAGLLRRVATGLLALATVAALAPALTGPGQVAKAGSYSFSGPEHCLMHRINRARARHGLRRLRADKQIAYVARRHARAMARRHSVWDDGRLGYKVTRWRRLGQNSGYAGRCRALFRAFMHSWPHRRNILGHYRFMGIGTKRKNGHLYAGQVFESRRDPGNVFHYP